MKAKYRNKKPMGRNSLLLFHACTHSPFAKCTNAVVSPQPKHSLWVISLKKQGIVKSICKNALHKTEIIKNEHNKIKPLFLRM